MDSQALCGTQRKVSNSDQLLVMVVIMIVDRNRGGFAPLKNLDDETLVPTLQRQRDSSVRTKGAQR